MSAELPVIEEAYDFLLRLLTRIQKFSRPLRHGVGQELEGRAQALLADLLRAKYTRSGPEKRDLLRECNLRIEILRYQLRLAHALQAISHDVHLSLVKQLHSLGGQIGGWLRSLTERTAS